MPIHAVCPQCRSAYDLAEEQRGKKVRCKKCATVFVAGAAAKPEVEDAVREVEPVRERAVPKNVVPVAPRRASARDDDDDDRETRRRPAPRKKSGSLGPVLLIGGLTVLGLVVIVAGAALIFGIRWLANDESAPKDPTIAAGWNPGNQNNQPDNARANKPPEENPDDNEPARFPIVVDDPEEANVNQAPPANGELAPHVLRRVKHATALILVSMTEGRASGSGFFAIEENVLITNAHVVGMLNPEADRPKSIEVVLDSGEKTEQKFGAQLLAVDRDADLAVLRVKYRPGQTSGTIPKPLDVKPARDLVETQKVYVFGFPFGQQLGTEITVSPAEVASFRKDSAGKLAKVQVKGDMQPGNSGGPVVNANGQVVGVAVSVIRNTSINFAVPGERVRDLLQGRIKESGFGQSYYRNSEVVMPVAMQIVDPLSKIKEVSLDIWTGDPDKPRPAASGESPKKLSGDSEHLTAALNYQVDAGKTKADPVGKATGDIVLPPLPPGKVYYVQPSWVKGAGTPRQWDQGIVYDMQPVERKAAKLALRQQKGERTLTLDTDRSLAVHGAGAKDIDVYSEKFSSQIREKTADVATSGATMKLQYFNVALVATGERQPEETTLLKNLPGHMGKITSGVIQDPQGNLQESPLDVQAVPLDARQRVLALHSQTIQALGAVAVPMPNKDKVECNESWTGQRLLAISTHEVPQVDSFAMTYTLLGTRKNAAGREEAVISLSGTPNGAGGRGATASQGNKASGIAVVDLATGQTTSAEFSASLDTAVGHEVRVTGTLKIKLKRSVP